MGSSSRILEWGLLSVEDPYLLKIYTEDLLPMKDLFGAFYLLEDLNVKFFL